jgi:hypothetical protein
VTDVRQELERHGARPDIDLVVRFALSLQEAAALRRRLAELETAGVTWVLEGFAPGQPPAPVVEEIVRRGPPV